MRVREGDYKGSKQMCINALKKKGFNGISSVAADCGVPIIILCIWYQENIEDSQEVKNKIVDISNFYGYTEIERTEGSSKKDADE